MKELLEKWKEFKKRGEICNYCGTKKIHHVNIAMHSFYPSHKFQHFMDWLVKQENKENE